MIFNTKPRLFTLDLTYDALPADLDGFTVLHLSDLHLGYALDLRDLEALLERASAHAPDMIVVTGDIADDLTLLPGALAQLAQFGAPHGAWASIGNHEYFRGIDVVRRTHARSRVPLLLESAATITVGDTALHIAGADDPVSLKGDLSIFMERTVAEALQERPPGVFTLLMSHRPQGFDAAARRGVELTLSGHTHGGQIGVGGRSLFEFPGGGRYLWGHYARGRSQLYTSAGAGSWFPVRIGCPPEAPLIRLRAAPVSDDDVSA